MADDEKIIILYGVFDEEGRLYGMYQPGVIASYVPGLYVRRISVGEAVGPVPSSFAISGELARTYMPMCTYVDTRFKP